MERVFIFNQAIFLIYCNYDDDDNNNKQIRELMAGHGKRRYREMDEADRIAVSSAKLRTSVQFNCDYSFCFFYVF